MNNLKKIFEILFLIIFILGGIFQSCGPKGQKSSIATITVLDSFTNEPVVNAKIRLHLDGQTSPISGEKATPPKPEYDYTDTYGQCIWTLQHPASYFAEVTTLTSQDTAQKLIQFKKGEDKEYTIYY